MNLLLRVLLALHLCGLVLMAGTTVIDYFTFKTFCSLTGSGDGRAQGLLSLMARYGGFVRTGAVMLILTGVLMFAINSSWWEQLWFKIKLALALLLVLNGIFSGNNLGLKFRKLALDNAVFTQKGAEVSAQLNRFYVLQLILFALLIAVSVIRPARQ